MPAPKDILVVTTSSLDGIKIKKYIKPVSAHIVTGTNLFSDFMGGLSDVFGGLVSMIFGKFLQLPGQWNTKFYKPQNQNEIEI